MMTTMEKWLETNKEATITEAESFRLWFRDWRASVHDSLKLDLI